jgi:hypothetical protein
MLRGFLAWAKLMLRIGDAWSDEKRSNFNV